MCLIYMKLVFKKYIESLTDVEIFGKIKMIAIEKIHCREYYRNYHSLEHKIGLLPPNFKKISTQMQI